MRCVASGVLRWALCICVVFGQAAGCTERCCGLQAGSNKTDAPVGLYPTLVENGGKTIPIVQAYWASRYLGRLETEWTLDGTLVHITGLPILIGGKNSTNYVPSDPEVGMGVACHALLHPWTSHGLQWCHNQGSALLRRWQWHACCLCGPCQSTWGTFCLRGHLHCDSSIALGRAAPLQVVDLIDDYEGPVLEANLRVVGEQGGAAGAVLEGWAALDLGMRGVSCPAKAPWKDALLGCALICPLG